MVDNVLLEVVLVAVGVELAAHEAASTQGGAKQWWRGGAVDEDSDASRMKRGWRRQTAKVEVSTGFAKPSNMSGTKACTGVANTGRTKGERTTKLQNGGDQ